MSRYYLKVSVVTLLLLSIAMIIIRAQPYQENRALRALLAPEGCEMPCFMGIRPGVTTVDEALALLENNDWVTNVHTSQSGIVWDWTGKQPDFIRTDMQPTIIYDPRNLVDLLWLYTSEPLGDMLITLPEAVNPPSGYSFLNKEGAAAWNISYTQDKLSFVIEISCDQWNVLYGQSAIVFASSISKPSYSMNWGDLNSRQERYCQ